MRSPAPGDTRRARTLGVGQRPTGSPQCQVTSGTELGPCVPPGKTPPPASCEPCQSRAMPEQSCDDISTGGGHSASTTPSPGAATSTRSPWAPSGCWHRGNFQVRPGIWQPSGTVTCWPPTRPRPRHDLAARSLTQAPRSVTLCLSGDSSWGQEGCCGRPAVPPAPCHRIMACTASSSAAPHCKDAAPSASRSLRPHARPKRGHWLQGAELSLDLGISSPGVSEGLVMSHLLLPVQRDPGTSSPQGVTASCLSFPICTVGLCSPRRVEMGAWLAEDASRVSNLTPPPRLGLGQGSLCSPPPQPLLPQGAATQGGFRLPRSPDRWDWRQTRQPSCPASPANHTTPTRPWPPPGACLPPRCSPPSPLSPKSKYPGRWAPRCSSASGTGG